MNKEMTSFIGLSVVLTGFSKEILAPTLDPIDIKSEYLTFLQEKLENGLLEKLLSEYDLLKDQQKTDQEIGESLLENPQFEDACRKIIFLWYAGAWPSQTATDEAAVSSLLSANSYTSGLVWQVMQSHPMGDSNYRYGYWSKQPAPLDAYTGTTTLPTGEY